MNQRERPIARTRLPPRSPAERLVASRKMRSERRLYQGVANRSSHRCSAAAMGPLAPLLYERNASYTVVPGPSRSAWASRVRTSSTKAHHRRSLTDPASAPRPDWPPDQEGGYYVPRKVDVDAQAALRSGGDGQRRRRGRRRSPARWPGPGRARRRGRGAGAPSRWNGWNSRSELGRRDRPGRCCATVMRARPSTAVVVTSTRPPGTLCRSALSTRLATRLSTRLRVAGRRRRRRASCSHRDAAVARPRPARPASTARGDVGEVERLPPLDALLAAGQREQRVDQPFLRRAQRQHVPAGRPQRLHGGVRVGQRHLQQGPLARSAACAARARRWRRSRRCDVERRLQPGEQVVEGLGQLGELVVAAGRAEPPVQVAWRRCRGRWR